MPRVLLLCEFPTLNGGERSLLAVVEPLRAAGFSFTAAAPPLGPLAEALRSRQIELLGFESRGPDGKALSLSARREALAAILAAASPDLVHANSLAMGRLSGPVAAEARRPSLASLRDIVGLGRQAAADLAG